MCIKTLKPIVFAVFIMLGLLFIYNLSYAKVSGPASTPKSALPGNNVTGGKLSPVLTPDEEVIGTLVSFAADALEIRTEEGKSYSLKINKNTIFKPSKKFFVLGMRVKAFYYQKNICKELRYFVVTGSLPNKFFNNMGEFVSLTPGQVLIKIPTGKILKLKTTSKTLFRPAGVEFHPGEKVFVYYDRNNLCLELKPGPSNSDLLAAASKNKTPIGIQGTLVSLKNNLLILKSSEGEILKLKITSNTLIRPKGESFLPGKAIMVYYDDQKNCLDLKPWEK
jgi:hypothetical protein